MTTLICRDCGKRAPVLLHGKPYCCKHYTEREARERREADKLRLGGLQAPALTARARA